MMRLPVFQLLKAMTERRMETGLPYSSPYSRPVPLFCESDGTDQSVS